MGKGTTFALKRFKVFQRKVTKNFSQGAFCFKADIKHYFDEVNHEVLINILKKKITDEDVLWLVRQILNNQSDSAKKSSDTGKGMPLGNYTSQFFANVYLNELDYFVKYFLGVRYYIRYVDDFIILHKSQKQLEIWKKQIDCFLNEKLKVELHPNKSRIIPLSRGVDFVGFRNFKNHRLLRTRNIRSMMKKIYLYEKNALSFGSLSDSYWGWHAYAGWGNTYKLRLKMKMKIIDILWDKIDA